MNEMNEPSNPQLFERELRGLVQTSRLIHAERDLDKLLVLVSNVASEMLDAEGCSVILRDSEKGGLIFYAVSGRESSQLMSFRLEEGEGVVGQCISKRTPMISNDVASDDRFSSRADIHTGFRTRSVLCVPLTVEEECIGAMEIVNKRRTAGFEQYDLVTSEAVASQIAVAIHNVQLAKAAVDAARLAAIGQSVAGISHCLKNMINGLQGALYFLKKDIKNSGAAVPDRGMQMFERHMRLLSDVVRNMLVYAKERPPEYEATDLNDLVGSVVELMQHRAQELGVDLRFHAGEGIGPVDVDPQGVYRCVLNLVINALDACGKGKSVDVTTRSVNAQQIMIEVADQGYGMDEETKQHLFQAFFSKKGSKGTGLGLAVTHKIVQEHRGSIEVDSTEEQGSTFRIYLPKRK